MLRSLKDVLSKSSHQPALCYAADVKTSEEIYRKIEEYGASITILKLHPEIIEDFSDKTIATLKEYSKKYEFLLWADQKMCDVPHIVLRQLQAVKWADMVSVMDIICKIPTFRDVDRYAMDNNIMLIVVNQLHTSGSCLWKSTSSNDDVTIWDSVIATVGNREEGLY